MERSSSPPRSSFPTHAVPGQETSSSTIQAVPQPPGDPKALTCVQGPHLQAGQPLLPLKPFRFGDLPPDLQSFAANRFFPLPDYVNFGDTSNPNHALIEKLGPRHPQFGGFYAAKADPGHKELPERRLQVRSYLTQMGSRPAQADPYKAHADEATSLWRAKQPEQSIAESRLSIVSPAYRPWHLMFALLAQGDLVGATAAVRSHYEGRVFLKVTGDRPVVAAAMLEAATRRDHYQGMQVSTWYHAQRFNAPTEADAHPRANKDLAFQSLTELILNFPVSELVNELNLPVYDAMRSDERWNALLGQIGLVDDPQRGIRLGNPAPT